MYQMLQCNSRDFAGLAEANGVAAFWASDVAGAEGVLDPARRLAVPAIFDLRVLARGQGLPDDHARQTHQRDARRAGPADGARGIAVERQRLTGASIAGMHSTAVSLHTTVMMAMRPGGLRT